MKSRGRAISKPGLAGGLARIVVALAFVLALYVGGYFALLVGDGFEPSWSIEHDPPWIIHPSYRAGGSFAIKFFSPIHRIDRKLRPNRWCIRAVDVNSLEWNELTGRIEVLNKPDQSSDQR